LCCVVSTVLISVVRFTLLSKNIIALCAPPPPPGFSTRVIVEVIDCDKLGHEAYRSGTACFHQLVAEFGPGIVGEDGEVNRRALGPIVFADPARLEALNGIVWPVIGAMVSEALAASSAKVCVVEAAVLLRAGWESMIDEVWLVAVQRKTALKRLMERNGLDEVNTTAHLYMHTAHSPSPPLPPQHTHTHLRIQTHARAYKRTHAHACTLSMSTVTQPLNHHRHHSLTHPSPPLTHSPTHPPTHSPTTRLRLCRRLSRKTRRNHPKRGTANHTF
jgi:dephospho-CoA kinase